MVGRRRGRVRPRAATRPDDEGGNPVGFLPNFAVDLTLPSEIGDEVAERLPLEAVEPPPQPGYGAPIVSSEKAENLALLLDSSNLTDGYRTVFHRVQTFDTDAIGYGQYLESLGYTPRVTECTFLIDLRDEWETIRASMDSGRRRSMRKALDQDHEVECLALEDDLRRTYEQYVANMERIDGRVLPRRFFEVLAERLSDRVRVFKATVDGDEIGRYVFLLDDERSVLHHWLSAIGDSADFEYYPSELLHRQAIRWGSQRGYDQYSLGPTKPNFSDSVYKFKEKYGATPHPSLCWERGTLPLVWHAYDRSRSLYRRSRAGSQ